jgi:transcriptional regulator with PAS, ATPase and Fis domain
MLMQYEFPGNIRELENLIEHAFVLCHAPQIEVEHLPREFVERFKEEKRDVSESKDKLKVAEVQIIIDALKKHGGNRSNTAAELGIDKSTLWRKMKKFNIKNL